MVINTANFSNIKNPRTNYHYFRSEFQSKHPNSKHEASKKWKSLSKREQDPHNKKADKDKERYHYERDMEIIRQMKDYEKRGDFK